MCTIRPQVYERDVLLNKSDGNKGKLEGKSLLPSQEVYVCLIGERVTDLTFFVVN